MGKGQSGKKGDLSQEPRNPRPAKAGKGRSAQVPRSDQLDDQGRQGHIGHGEAKVEPGRRRFEEGEDEGLGRPVRVEEDAERKRPQGEWDDKQEGTSRPEEPGR